MLDVMATGVPHVSGGPALPTLGSADVFELVPMREAIDLVDDAMRALSAGQILSPERWAMPVAETGKMGIMPGASSYHGCFGIKVLSLFAPDARHELPSHQGVMLLFDLPTGRPLCAMEGNALTSLRTAAASAAASRALALEDSSILTIIGCGEQAPLHVEALRLVRPIREVRLWNRTPARALDLARTLQADTSITVKICPTTTEAVRGAHIVCTLTSADDPIVFGADAEPGQHFNLVGSSIAGPREVDDALVEKGVYVADSRAHALSQAAELLSAIAGGRVRPEHVVGEIGQVLSGALAARKSTGDITIYKSLGHIVQDLAVADAAYRKWSSEA